LSGVRWGERRGRSYPITGAVVLIQHRTIADSVSFALMSLLGADVLCLPFGLISLLRSDRQLNP
jgi:hypothetical protein